jgi:ubiquitin-conjugating enzyme E2 O
MWKNEDEKRPAVVQSVDAARRTATVLFPSTNTIELVSLLELDPQGTSDVSQLGPDRPPDGLGVHRGELVLIHRPGSTNGYPNPWVPKIGELEPWLRDILPSDGGWRKQLRDLGAELMRKRETQIVEEPDPQNPARGTGNCLWLGEVNGVSDSARSSWFNAIADFDFEGEFGWNCCGNVLRSYNRCVSSRTFNEAF